MSAKMATLDLLQIKLFWNNRYDAIISVYNVTNKILSRDWNYIVGVVIRPKFGNSIISLREIIIISIWWGFDEENHFFWGLVLVQVQ